MVGHAMLDICLAGVALYVVVRLVWRRSPPLPPGPPGWPLIGRLLDIRTDDPYKTLAAMSSKHGPIITLRALGKELIFINTFKAAKDLLEKQSAITANRPHFLVCGELVGWDNTTPFLQYGDKYRKHRKIFNQHIGTKSNLVIFHPTIEAEAKQFACNVLRIPDDLGAQCRRTIVSCVLQISHGYTVKGGDDPFEGMAHRAMGSIAKSLTPGYCLMDWLPILRYLPEWFPGCGFHKDAKQWRNMVSDTVNMQHEFVLEQLAKGDAVPSLFSHALRGGLTPEDEDILKWASFSVYLGMASKYRSQNWSTYVGALQYDERYRGQTPYILLAFFRAMTMYPEVQKKAQAEVDTIVGNDRLPTMEDRDALPYVNAICMEILRWNVVAPITVHTSTQDILYEGCLIPKGSIILPNMWFILSDPETYPDPERFDPERFLGEHQQPDPREACFGWGRRACPGERLAESMIFIYVAMALATLEVSRYIENGVEYVPRYEFEEGFLRRFKPFKYKITPRSKKAEDLLQG